MDDVDSEEDFEALPSFRLPHWQKYAHNSSREGKKDLHFSSPGTSNTSDYTYKKVSTVIKQTSVSSSGNPKKETVVKSSSKTIIRTTPKENEPNKLSQAKSGLPTSVSSEESQASSGGKDFSAKSALSGFRLTRRKIKNKPSNIIQQTPFTVPKIMIKEVVTKVLKDHRKKELPCAVDDPVPVLLDTSDVMESVSWDSCASADNLLSSNQVGNMTSSAGASSLNISHRAIDSQKGLRQENAQKLYRSENLSSTSDDINIGTTKKKMRNSATGNASRSLLVPVEKKLKVKSNHRSFTPRQDVPAVNESKLYRGSVISSSEQPYLGEPDCVIVLSDSD